MPIGTTIQELQVRIGASIDEALKGFDKVQQRAKTLGRNFTSIGKSMTLGVSAPIVGIGVAATKAAIDFESSFAGIRKTMDLTEQEFGALAKANRTLAKEIPVSVDELNRIGELAGQLGIRGVDNVVKFEKTIAQLAVTTDLTAEEGALAFAQIANVMQLPQDQIDRLGAAVVGLGNNFATVESSIVEFSSRIAGAGQLTDLTTGDVTGIATAFSSLGVNAEAGGTAVQKVLLSMQQSVVEGGEQLEGFAKTAGVSAEAFAAQFRDNAGQAFVAFVEGLGEQGEGAIGTLNELGLTDQRLTRAFLAAAGAGDLLSRAVAQGNEEFEKNTALVQEAAQRFGTTESQMKLFLNAIDDIRITLGDALIPALTSAFEAAKPIIGAVAGIAEAFANADPAIQKTVLVIAGAFAAGGPILIALGALTAAFAAISWPVVLGVAAIAGAIAAITFAWSKWGDDIATIVRATIEVIKLWFVEPFKQVASVVTGTVEGITNTFKWMYDQVVGGSYVPDMIIGIQDSFGMLDAVMVAPAVDGTRRVTSAFRQMNQEVSEAHPVVLDAIRSSGAAIGEWARSSGRNIESFVSMAVIQLGKLAAKMAIFKGIEAIFGAATGGIGGAIFGGIGSILGFQHGGSFTVGGSGGPDSQLVVFKGTPGEDVTVTPPGGGGNGNAAEVASALLSRMPPLEGPMTPREFATSKYMREVLSVFAADGLDRGVSFA